MTGLELSDMSISQGVVGRVDTLIQEDFFYPIFLSRRHTFWYTTPHAAKDSNMLGINLAYYRKKDWKRFIKIIDDRDSMHDTWHDWHKAFQKTKRDLGKYR